MLRKIARTLKRAWYDFNDDDCFTQAAAVAYYAIFSIPPLFLTVIFVAGTIWNEQVARENLSRELTHLLNEISAEFIMNLIQRSDSPSQSRWATTLSTAMLFIGSTGVMLQLQAALNRAWSVQAKASDSHLSSLIFKRALSFAMVFVVAAILVLSLVATTILARSLNRLDVYLPGEAMSWAQYMGNLAANYFIVMPSLAALFRWLPDRPVKWRDVWFGANLTTMLFILGKELLGWYLGTNPMNGYGGAGALVMLLTWIYYTCLIILFGAELTHVASKENQMISTAKPSGQGRG